MCNKIEIVIYFIKEKPIRQKNISFCETQSTQTNIEYYSVQRKVGIGPISYYLMSPATRWWIRGIFLFILLCVVTLILWQRSYISYSGGNTAPCITLQLPDEDASQVTL